MQVNKVMNKTKAPINNNKNQKINKINQYQSHRKSKTLIVKINLTFHSKQTEINF